MLQENLNDSIYPNEVVKSKIENIPTRPGIYQFYNYQNIVIYVGKAKNLKNRVKSYFTNRNNADAKTKALVANINDLEFIIVDSEVEALLLEDNLIKSLLPRYNVLLKDDKTYPYIKITNEEFPRIMSTRKVIKDGSKYYGPYTDGHFLKIILKLIKTLFKIRSCDLKLNEKGIENNKFKICLDYHIHKCEAPCVAYISKEEYNKNINNARQLLLGKSKELEKAMEEEMIRLAENFEFEKANSIKNKLLAISNYNSKQKIVDPDLADRDVFGLKRQDDYACSIILKIRNGKLLGKKHFIIKNAQNLADDDIMSKTIEKWYLDSDLIPSDIYIPFELTETEMLTNWLNKISNKTIHIHIPKIGDKRKLIEMANTNAHFILSEYLIALDKRDQTIPRTLLSLQRDLRLTKPPRVIECFDNSHLQGTELVSSMVVFNDGKPKKSEYRKFIAKEHKNDDFHTMHETVYRRYRRQLDEEKKLPDLIIIDGGKGQLSAAYQALKELNLEQKISIFGLAKRLEEIFVVDSSEAILLPRTSSSLRLLQQIRDEAHRFAITFHRQRRDKKNLNSELIQIEGIGDKTSIKLLQKYGSIANILNQTDEELLKTINNKVLQNLRNYNI